MNEIEFENSRKQNKKIRLRHKERREENGTSPRCQLIWLNNKRIKLGILCVGFTLN